MNDLMMLRGMDSKEGLSPYEQVKLDHMTAKSHTGGVAVAGLVTGVAGVTIAATAWLFGGMYSNAKAKEAKETAQSAKEISAAQYQAALQLMNAQNQNTNATLDRVVRALERETDARTSGDQTITQTITDTVSGSQQSALTAQQAAELSSVNSVMQTTFSDFVTGRASLNPTPVSLYSAPQPCACPASGCGCGA